MNPTRVRMLEPRPTRGLVTAVAMMFLIATVVFALGAMLTNSASGVVDGQRQAGSTAAFFLAESGLESGRADLGVRLAAAATVTEATCSGLTRTDTYPSGSVVVTATSDPATCTGIACTGCTLRATAIVGQATRTLEHTLGYFTQSGVFCNGPVTNNCSNSPSLTWKLALSNNTTYDGIALFNLAYTTKGNGVATCPTGAGFLVCQKQFDLGSPTSGTNSGGIMGNTVTVPKGSTTYPIYQIMDKNDRGLVEVGVIFNGLSAAPTLTGRNVAGGASYWYDGSSGSSTVGTSSATGRTNHGALTATGSGPACAATSAGSQTCTDWCYGGDTLVMSYAAKVATRDDTVSSVKFNGIEMKPVAQYAPSNVPGAPDNIKAEIWVVQNQNYAGATPESVNASSYKGRGTGAVGAQWTTINNPSNVNDTKIFTTAAGVGTLTIDSVTGWPAALVLPGDTITSTTGSTTVTATIGTQTSSGEVGALTTGQGGRGTYTLSSVKENGAVAASGKTYNGKNVKWTVNSTVMNVSACTICIFADGDPLSAGVLSGRKISGTQTTSTAFGRTETIGGIGRYPINGAATQVAPLAPLYAGTPDTTVYVPSTSALPAVTAPEMMVAVKSGTGVIVPGTTVKSVSVSGTPNAVTRSFTLSATPTTPLDDTTVCGGACAFFANGSGTTPFTFNKTAGTSEWAAAFTCLKGVDVAPRPVQRITIGANSRWTEVVN